ncbi:hypothetical protein, partial [Propionivibrio sp.]|uniref:hypothetical protein n=1 Tax=Propionivibrio sp. TaxID=2212460 RepID=UPI0025E5FF27
AGASHRRSHSPNPPEPERVVASAADDLEAAHTTSADWIQRITDVGARSCWVCRCSPHAGYACPIFRRATHLAMECLMAAAAPSRSEKLAPSTVASKLTLGNPGITG